MNEAQQAALAEAGSKLTFAGAGTSFGAWAVSSQAGIVVGIVIGVAGLLINWYYKAKQDRRDEAAHALRMKADK